MFEGLHPPTIIALGALISILGFVFYALLYPVREKQSQMEADIKELKAGQARFDKRLDSLEQGQARFDKRLDSLEQGQARFDRRMDSLEKKLDQLLAAKS